MSEALQRMIETIMRIVRWIECLFRRTRKTQICDIRFSLQNRYVSAPELETALGKFNITNNAYTLSGSALCAGNNVTIDEFISDTRRNGEPCNIREKLENYLDGHGIDNKTHHLVILDIEPGGQSVEGIKFHPQHLGNFPLSERDPIIEGYKRRISVARSVFQNAKLALYGVVVPHSKGKPDQFDPSIDGSKREGYERAGELGMYDQLDYLVPVLYNNWGTSDVENRHGGHDLDKLHGWIEKSTRQAIEETQRLTRRNETSIPLAPFLGFWVGNPCSKHDTKAILPETVALQFQIVQSYCSVSTIVFWSGPETQEEMRAKPREVIDFHHFFSEVGELPPRGCADI